MKDDVIFGAEQNEEMKKIIREVTSDFKMQEGERVNPVLVEQELPKVIEDQATQSLGGIDSPVQQINRDTERNLNELRRQIDGTKQREVEVEEMHDEIKRARDKVYEYSNDWSIRPMQAWWEFLLAAPVRFFALALALPVRMWRSFRGTAQPGGKDAYWEMPSSFYFTPRHYLSYQVLREAQLQKREEQYLAEQGLKRAADEATPYAKLSDEDILHEAILYKTKPLLPGEIPRQVFVEKFGVAVLSMQESISRLQQRFLAKPALSLPELPQEVKDRPAWQVLWMSLLPDKATVPEPVVTGDWWHPRSYTGQETMTGSTFKEANFDKPEPEAPASATAKPAAAAEAKAPAKGVPLGALHAAAAEPLDDFPLPKAAAKPALSVAKPPAALDATAKPPADAMAKPPAALDATAKPAAALNAATKPPAVPDAAPKPPADAMVAPDAKAAAVDAKAAPAATEAGKPAAATGAAPPGGGAAPGAGKPAGQKPDAPVVLYTPPVAAEQFEDHSLSALPKMAKPMWQSWPRFLYSAFSDWCGAELGVPGGVRFSTYLALRMDLDSAERLWAEEELYRKEQASMPVGTKWMNRIFYPEQMRVYARPEVHWRDFNNVLWMRGVDVCNRYPSLGTNFFDIRQRLKPVLTSYFRGLHLMDPDMIGEVAIPQHVDHMFKTKEEVDAEMPPASGPILHVMNQTLIRRVFKISVKSLALWNEIILISTSCVIRTRPWMRNMETGETLYGGPKRRAVFKYFVKLAGFPNSDKPGEVSWKVVDSELFRGKARRKRRKRKRRTLYRRFQ